MVTKVFVIIGLSLDGYMAPEGMDMAHFNEPGYKNWGAKWGALMAWGILRHFRAFSTPKRNPALGVLSTPAPPPLAKR
jgi:hypothetical protein